MTVRTQIVSSKPVRLTPQGLEAVPLRAVRFTLVSCRDQKVLVAESVTCIRHFVPKFNCFERRDQFPFPVHSHRVLEASVPPCLFNIPLLLASTPLAVANHPVLDPGNVSIVSTYSFPSSVLS
jgi:hypothetical protein